MGWLKLFTHDDARDVDLLCPRCEKPLGKSHDEGECARRGSTRRLFLGVLGASVAALTLRERGVPLPTARVQVRAYSQDLIEVPSCGPQGFAIAFEQAKDIHGRPYRADYGQVTTDAGLLNFAPPDRARVRVSAMASDLCIVGVIDAASQKPLPYRVVRAKDVVTLLESAAIYPDAMTLTGKVSKRDPFFGGRYIVSRDEYRRNIKLVTADNCEYNNPAQEYAAMKPKRLDPRIYRSGMRKPERAPRLPA